MLVSHSWLKDYLGESIPSPEEIERLLTFHAFEIEGVETVGADSVIDVDVLPNRSSDCLSHRGIAREIATITGNVLAHDPLKPRTSDVLGLKETNLIAIDIKDTEACPRFTAALITGVEIKESPDWLKERLVAIGQRPINNIVDATNYVMYALGQPLHAYDADRFPQVDGTWQFVVRTAKEGEVVSLLAEGGSDADRDVTLTGTETLVVDGSSDTPIGLAGVKGGRFAGVHEGTTRVIIEAANWHPTRTRQTARQHGIITDAGKRFENDISPLLAPYAQEAIIALITDIAGGACEGYADSGYSGASNPEVTVVPERVNALLGLTLTKDEMCTILTRTGCRVTDSGEGFSAVGPFERTDLNIAEDFIEEIGRIYGYEHVSAVTPEPVVLTEYNARHFYSERIRAALIACGFSEVITSSFRKKDEIRLKNALASDKGCLRSSLTENIAEVLVKNVAFLDLLGVSDIRVFEIGTVFEKSEDGVSEHVALCLGVRTKQSGPHKKDDAVIEAAVDALNTALPAQLSATSDAGIVEFNLTSLLETLPDPTTYDAVEQSSAVSYRPFSTYPHVSRDIALWTEGVTADEVEAVLNAHAGDLRVRTDLFDEFTKEGRTSYAFRLVFQADDRTLTDAEVNTLMDAVYAAVEEKGWEVR